jgi:hypothetical protein
MIALLRRRCALCRRWLLLSAFYRKGAGHHSYCKLCHWDRTRELRAMHAEQRAAA